MKTTLFQKAALLVSGLTAVGIGSAILLTPHAFYAAYGIGLGGDPNLLSEIRAPGGALATMGAFILSGLAWPRFVEPCLTLSAGLYLAWGTARLVSVALDGLPDNGLIWATGLELAIGTVCFFAGRMSKQDVSSLPTASANL